MPYQGYGRPRHVSLQGNVGRPNEPREVGEAEQARNLAQLQESKRGSRKRRPAQPVRNYPCAWCRTKPRRPLDRWCSMDCELNWKDHHQ